MATDNHYVLHQCHLKNITAHCGHGGEGVEGKHEGGGGKQGPESGAVKHGQAAPPIKHGQAAPGEPKTEGGGPRLAKDGPPHAAPAGRPPGPAPARPPGPGARPPASPAKNLMLQVVPTAAEAPKKGAEAPKKSIESHGVKVTPAAQPGSQGDVVTVVAATTGPCSKYPQWKIKDFGRGTVEIVEGKTTLKHTFLRPAPLTGVRPFLGVPWLETVRPRHYLVECHVPAMEPGAHHRLDVLVYPPDKPELELSSKGKSVWEEKMESLKTAFEALIEHAAELIPPLSKFELEVLEGKVTIKNGWEEVKNSNLAHFKVDADADIELVKVTAEFTIPALAFFKKIKGISKVVGEAEKVERFFQEKIGLYVEAGLFLTVGVTVKGAASWEKEEHGFTAHLESLAVEEGASIALEARLDVEYDKDGKRGELAMVHGKASSEMTLSTSPRLEPGPHLWLDSKFSWNPLTLKIKAEINGPDKSVNLPHAGKMPAVNKKLSKADTDKAVTAPAPAEKKKPLASLGWKGDVFPKIEKPLPSIDLFTGATQAHPPGKERLPLRVRPVPAPAPKPPKPPAPAPPK